MDQAHRLAGWVAERRCALTPGGALRPSEVPAAATVLGIAGIQRVRRAADVPTLQRAWIAAVGSGLVAAGAGAATEGKLRATWASADDARALSMWLAGLRAVCAADSDRKRPDSVISLVLVVLRLLDSGGQDPTLVPGSPRGPLMHEAHSALARDHYLSDRVEFGMIFRWLAPAGNRDRGWKLFTLLEQFGALTGSPEAPQITSLGRWTAAALQAELPKTIEPELAEPELLTRLAAAGDETEVWRAVQPWLVERAPLHAARALLGAAVGAAPAERLAAVTVADALGEEVLPAWREMLGAPDVGPHARAALALWDQGPGRDPDDARWLVVEDAVAALTVSGPDEALCCLLDGIPGADLHERIADAGASGHPQADVAVQALGTFLASGVSRTVDQVFQLKVVLTGWRPSIWRRVLMPATHHLAELHRVIQVLFGWNGDHLHAFAVGQREYSDPFYPLERMGDEYGARLRSVFTPTIKKIEYRYDFGADWQHEILLEKVLPRGPEQVYPCCVAFAGESPGEYPEEEPQPRRPFDVEAVNRRFAAWSAADDEDADDQDDDDRDDDDSNAGDEAG